MNETKHRILPYVIVGVLIYLLLVSLLGYFFIDRYEREKALYLNHRLSTIDVQIESIKLAYDTIAQTTFQTAINTPDVTALMAKASAGDEQTKQTARKALYRHLKRLYFALEEHNVRQLHFHLPGSISFLRFHRPGKYGDSLQGIRPAIDAVNRDLRSVNGFEEGRIFNGFRHIFPLFHEGEFIGTVELSYSFDAIKDLALQLYPARYEMILKRSVIDAKVFQEEKHNYAAATLHPDYVVDKHLHKNYESVISNTLLEALNQNGAKAFDAIGQKKTHSIIPITHENKGYLLWIDPLFSFDYKHVGYILAYIADQHLLDLQKELKNTIIFVLVSVALLTFVIVLFIFRLRTQHAMLIKNANTDRLTQIPNRAYMILQLEYMMRHSRRNDLPLSVIFLDIDHFKHINDTYGHRSGDSVLVELSSLMSQRLRESDILGRWGGEEFVIILPHTALKEAIGVAEKLRQMIESHRFDHGKATCSLGVAQMIEDDTDETLIHRADAMLYVAKSHGRNQVRPKAE